MGRTLSALAIGLGSIATIVGAGSGAPASAATGANFVATGHDMDLHCDGGNANECAYLKILTDKVRNGSTLPILALDQGTELSGALTAIGESPVTVIDPSNTAVFNATAFVNGAGNPLFSAIITASDTTCGGCDNDLIGEANINARKNDFTTFFNAGGGILALTGADNRATYYNFVPLSGLSAVAVSPPFTVTPAGAAIGITDAMANCCPTHNSFSTPPGPLVVLETDLTGQAETIAAFGASIGGGGFVSLAASKTADAGTATPGSQDGYTVTITNSATTVATLASVTDTLPAGFSYVAGSTTGGITANPGIVGSQLTWIGPFTVPASGTFQFHFNVTVSATPGRYTNTVAADGGATAVTPATNVAPIDVATIGAVPAFPLEGLPIAVTLAGGAFALWWPRRRALVT